MNIKQYIIFVLTMCGLLYALVSFFINESPNNVIATFAIGFSGILLLWVCADKNTEAKQ